MPLPANVTPEMIAEALELLEQRGGQLSDFAAADLPERIIRILPHAQAVAESKVDDMQARLAPFNEVVARCLEEVQRPSLSRKARMSKLRDLATLINKALLPITACAAGSCSHCCHIPVTLYESEAALIGEAIGRKPKRVAPGKELSTEYGYHRPCTFLKRGKCSIYVHRPFACRLHLNVDESDRLCEIIPEASVPVPLVDTRQFQGAYVQAGHGDVLADIRDFFPPVA